MTSPDSHATPTERASSLRLTRLEDSSGSSAGRWLVNRVAGLVMFKDRGRWYFLAYDPQGAEKLLQPGSPALRAWGAEANLEFGSWMLGCFPQLIQSAATRSELLLRLESILIAEEQALDSAPSGLAQAL